MNKSEYDAILAKRRDQAVKVKYKPPLPPAKELQLGNKNQYNLNQRESEPLPGLLDETSNALYRIPVFLSYATPFNTLQAQFLDRAIEEIREDLLFPRTLGRSDQYTETPLTAIRRIVISSYGLIAFAFRRAFVERAISRPGTPREQIFENFWLSSPYLQIEPSMAYQQGLPVTLFVENGVSTNSVFGGILQLGAAPLNVVTFTLDGEQDITNFFNSVDWKETFADWSGEVRACYNKRTSPQFKCQSDC